MDRDLFVRLAAALELGDWRRVKIDAPRVTGLSKREAEVLFLMGLLAESMRLQTVGRVREAQRRVEEARRLVLRLTSLREPGLQPSPERIVEHALWRVSRVAWREHMELRKLQEIFSDLPRGYGEVVQATVEFLTFVEFDPFVARVPAGDIAYLGLDPVEFDQFNEVASRKALFARTTDLRQFGEARTGTISDKLWQRVDHGFRGFRSEALELLAGEPLRRWEGREDIPVRQGRRNAWNFAQQGAPNLITRN